jgi:hypothetical protein
MKRYLYQGIHEIPVFNLKIQDEPIMFIFKFTVYRTAVKIYFEAMLFPNQLTPHESTHFINKNKRLVLELSEKLAIKHLISNENDFALLISNLLIVANN